MTRKAIQKTITAQDREAARQSMNGLNAALRERFGHLPDVQVIPWISDLHLHKGTDYEKLPAMYVEHVDTGRQFLLAMEEIQALQPSASLLVLGGDITDYSLPEEWRRFRQLIDQSGWTKPVVPAFGNHDNKNQSRDATISEALRTIWSEIKRPDWPDVSEPGELFYSVTHHGVKWLVLDTMRDVDYRLSEQQKSWLHRELQEAGLPIVVVCHRHFLNVGSWVDEKLIIRDKELWTMLDECPAVLGVLSGHVHFSTLWEYRDKWYCTFPSIAFGLGEGTGWGGIVLSGNKIAAVFVKELYGEGYEQYNGLTHQEGKFVFMEPQSFLSHKLRNPYYWPASR